jgi:hypothetical protein
MITRFALLYARTAKGNSTTVSRSDIRLIQHLDSSAHGLVRMWRLIGYFPIHSLLHGMEGCGRRWFAC